MRAGYFSCILIFGLNSSSADLAEWVGKESTLSRNGDAVSVFCIGNGISLDLARENAYSGCQRAALSQIPSPVSVRSESIQSEKDTAFHEDVSQAFQVRNLRCQPEHEAIEKGEDSFNVYLRCRYDLGKISVGEVAKEAMSEKSQSESQLSLVDAEPNASSKTYKSKIAGRMRRSSSRHISLTAIPACDSIIISGSKPSRVIRCESTPQIVMVEIGFDQSMIVRPKDKNYLPKTLSLKNRAPAFERLAVEVYFESTH